MKNLPRMLAYRRYCHLAFTLKFKGSYGHFTETKGRKQEKAFKAKKCTFSCAHKKFYGPKIVSNVLKKCFFMDDYLNCEHPVTGHDYRYHYIFLIGVSIFAVFLGLIFDFFAFNFFPSSQSLIIYKEIKTKSSTTIVAGNEFPSKYASRILSQLRPSCR